MNRHQALLRGLLHAQHAWDSDPFLADRSRRMGIYVVGRAGLRDASNREYRDKSILCWASPTQTRKRSYTCEGGSADHDGSTASTSEARKRQPTLYACSKRVFFDERSHKLDTYALGSFQHLGVEVASSSLVS